MKEINTYLIFDGNCREAMKFYEKCFGGDLFMMTFSESEPDVAKEYKDKIMHSRLVKGNALLMASDRGPAHSYVQGNNFAVSISCDNLPEIEKIFSAMSEKGKVTMALHDAFWGARFGMLTDQFGINWMFNCELPKKG